MIQYDVVSSGSVAGLIAIVQTRVLDGWQPQGGICAAHISVAGFGAHRLFDLQFYQAMVRYAEPAEGAEPDG